MVSSTFSELLLDSPLSILETVEIDKPVRSDMSLSVAFIIVVQVFSWDKGEYVVRKILTDFACPINSSLFGNRILKNTDNKYHNGEKKSLNNKIL